MENEGWPLTDQAARKEVGGEEGWATDQVRNEGWSLINVRVAHFYA